MRTYADELEKKRKEDEIKLFLGRDKELPGRLVGLTLETDTVFARDVLKQAGYQYIRRGWVRQFAQNKRYHAYVHEDKHQINIHTDYIDSKGKHRASADFVPREIKRIKRMNKLMVAGPRLTPSAHKVKPKHKSVALPYPQQMAALAKLRKEREEKASPAVSKTPVWWEKLLTYPQKMLTKLGVV